MVPMTVVREKKPDQTEEREDSSKIGEQEKEKTEREQVKQKKAM